MGMEENTEKKTMHKWLEKYGDLKGEKKKVISKKYNYLKKTGGLEIEKQSTYNDEEEEKMTWRSTLD